MSNLRTGLYGNYIGSVTGESSPLTKDQMKVNAKYIFSYLGAKGWTKQAIAGMLGNMEAESTINPGRWQNDSVGNTSNGYGIVQWTPASKYINWCGSSDPSTMDNNLARIVYEVENNIQWIATDTYNFSFSAFTKSTQSSEYLAKAFLLNYERPADQSGSVQNYRASLGASWYAFLGGVNGSGSSPAKRRKKFNFILFNKRSKNRWIKQS